MSVLTLKVDEVMRTLSAESSNPFVVHDKEVDIVRFAINSGFADIVLDGQVALRVMYQRPGESEVRAKTLTYYDTDGLHNYYDWQLSQSDLAKNGSLMVALCILDISGGEVSEWHTTPCAVRVLSTIHTDDSDEGDAEVTPTVKERVAVLETMIQRVASGAPIVVSSVSAMTDTSRIYVLTTDGKWYYYDGSAWVAGGEYGGVAAGSITTDKLADEAVTAGKIASGVVPVVDSTLTQTGAAADAKVAGDELNDLKSAINNITGNEIIQFSNPALKQYINTSGETVSWDTPSTSSATNVKWAVVECQPGDKFTINGKGGYSDRLWAFADSSKNILSKSNANVTATNLLITAPNNSAYLIINDEINKQSFVGELLVNIVEDNANQATEQITNVKSEIMQTYNILYGNINLLQFSAKSKTTSGITFVENANGTVIVNGTSTSNSIYAISFTPVTTGLYHLSGCPTGGSSTQYYQKINDIAGKDIGEGVEVTLTAGINYSVWIVIISGRTVTNLEFKPTLMLKSKSISFLSDSISTLPFVPQTPPLFEGGFSAVTGKYYHDTSESWLKSRVRTNVVRIAKGATIKTSGAYQLTISKYSDYNLDNFIENIASQMAMTEWTCPADGYYTITFKLTSGGGLTIDAVKATWNFEEFYCIPDDRIFIHWIGTGNSEESSTHTDSGDCTFLVFPDGEGLLIDSANKRNYASLRKRIAEAGFYHIKNIIISHFHDDHIGGLIQMVNSGYTDITGATVYLPDYNATLWAYNNGVMSNATKTLYDEAMTIFTNAGCNLVYPDTDFKPYQIGGAVLSFYNCDMEWYKTHSANYNDWSLCNYIFYGNMTINFTGDIGPIAQEHLGGTLYKTNVYKADHHGWLNQTTIPADYINNVSPDVVIALDGQVHDQYIGTDTAPLIKWCEKYGVPYYRKYTNNEIKMAVSKNSWCFESKVKRTTLT